MCLLLGIKWPDGQAADCGQSPSPWAAAAVGSRRRRMNEPCRAPGARPVCKRIQKSGELPPDSAIANSHSHQGLFPCWPLLGRLPQVWLDAFVHVGLQLPKVACTAVRPRPEASPSLRPGTGQFPNSRLGRRRGRRSRRPTARSRRRRARDDCPGPFITELCAHPPAGLRQAPGLSQFVTHVIHRVQLAGSGNGRGDRLPRAVNVTTQTSRLGCVSCGRFDRRRRPHVAKFSGVSSRRTKPTLCSCVRSM